MKISKKYSYYFILGLMFLCTILLRVYKLAQLPDILHIDEAGLGYNAWCLAHYGTDRYLNVHPFYAQNFEGGQSPLYTYMLVLLIKTIGCGNVSLWLTRLPAVIASLLSAVSMGADPFSGFCHLPNCFRSHERRSLIQFLGKRD